MKNIAVAIDFDEQTDDILEVVAGLAASTGGEVHLVHIYPPEPETLLMTPYVYPMPIGGEDVEMHESMLQGEAKRIREYVIDLHEKKIPATGYMKPAQFDIPRAIRDFAKEKNCDLLVIGSHRPGRLERLVLGSVAAAVLRKATIPVLIVPRGEPEK